MISGDNGNKTVGMNLSSSSVSFNITVDYFIYLFSLKHLQVNVAHHHEMGAKGKIQ